MVKVAVVGSMVMDFIFETPRRPVKGESIVGKAFSMAPGGKGANQAMQAALLGAKVYMIGRAGDDIFGTEIINSLSRAGVDTTYIKRDPAGTACSGVVLDSEGDNSIVMVPRANMKCDYTDVEDARPAIEDADIILLQLEIPLKVNEKVVKLARKLGKKIILDPAPACPIEDFYFENVDIMKPNETEATILTGIDVVDDESAVRAAEDIARRGVKTVMITMGGRGVLIYSYGRAAFVEPPKVNVRDTTAAGDSFTGAFAVFLCEGCSLEEAARKAVCTSAISVTRLGAQPSLPNRDEVEKFFAEHAGH